MEALTTVAPGLAMGIALHVFFSKSMNALFPSTEVVDGYAPMYYVLCTLNQAVVLPLCIYGAWTSRPEGPLEEYVSTPIGALFSKGHVYEQWYLFALIGAQAKDLFPPPRAAPLTMLVHHAIVITTCLVATFGPGGVLFVYGSFALELGSMLFNIYSLNKKSLPVQVSYQIVMLFSNLAAMGVIFWAYLHETVSPAYMTAYFLFGSLLCAGRQRHALIELGKFVARPANKKEE